MKFRVIFLAAGALVVSNAIAQDLRDLFEVDASLSSRTQATPYAGNVACQQPTLERLLGEMDRLLKQGESLRAAGWGRALASNAAACALLVREGSASAGDLKFLTLLAGEGLATSVLTNDPALNSAAEARAKAYLAYASDAYPRAAATLRRIDALRPPPPIRTDKPSLSVSAQQIVQDVYSNAFAFWTKYTGKTIAIRGAVLSVTGSEKSATVSLDGRPKGVTNDQMSFMQRTDCVLSDPLELEKAAALRKGTSATITGVVGKGVMGNITLQSCKVS